MWVGEVFHIRIFAQACAAHHSFVEQNVLVVFATASPTVSLFFNNGGVGWGSACNGMGADPCSLKSMGCFASSHSSVLSYYSRPFEMACSLGSLSCYCKISSTHYRTRWGCSQDHQHMVY